MRHRAAEERAMGPLVSGVLGNLTSWTPQTPLFIPTPSCLLLFYVIACKTTFFRSHVHIKIRRHVSQTTSPHPPQHKSSKRVGALLYTLLYLQPLKLCLVQSMHSINMRGMKNWGDFGFSQENVLRLMSKHHTQPTGLRIPTG